MEIHEAVVALAIAWSIWSSHFRDDMECKTIETDKNANESRALASARVWPVDHAGIRIKTMTIMKNAIGKKEKQIENALSLSQNGGTRSPRLTQK